MLLPRINYIQVMDSYQWFTSIICPSHFFFPQFHIYISLLPPKHLIKCIHYSLYSSSYLYYTHINNIPTRLPISAQLHIPKLMELKTFPPSFITVTIPSPFPYHKSYASAIISYSSRIPIIYPLVHHVPHNSTKP